MSSDDLDAATLAHYRAVIERAAAGDPSAKGATAAVFAALDRRDHEWRELREIARAVADAEPYDINMQSGHVHEYGLQSPVVNLHAIQDKARALLAR